MVLMLVGSPGCCHDFPGCVHVTQLLFSNLSFACPSSPIQNMHMYV
jgi:hypothetical protein